MRIAAVVGLAVVAATALHLAIPAGVQSAEPPAATADEFDEAEEAVDYDAAAEVLESLVRSRPADVGLLDEDRIIEVLDEAEVLAEGSTRRAALLEALFEAEWTPRDATSSFAFLWREVVLNRIEQGRVAEAKAAAAKIDAYTVVIRMRADKRFDSVTQGGSALADPLRLLDALIAKARVAVRERPEVSRQLAGMLLDRGEPGEALGVVDAALGSAELEDWERGILLYNRSRALKELGRTEEAIEALRQAAALESHRALDLANLLMSLDRGSEAVRALDAADAEDWSPRQRAIAATWRFCSLNRTGARPDEAPVRALAADLDEAGRAALLDNLLFCAGQREEAAEHYKRLLADPHLRGAFLFRLQRYARSPHPTPGGEAVAAWRSELLARPDVREALERVGRIEAYAIRTPSGTG